MRARADGATLKLLGAEPLRARSFSGQIARFQDRNLKRRTFKNRPFKICLISGTRPEIIKLAPLYRKLAAVFGARSIYWIATGQHHKLADQAMGAFGVRPAKDLKIMKPDQSPAAVLQELIGALDRLVRKTSPSLIVVQGDTSSTLAGSLAGFLNRIPVAHVEAGLRTFDSDNPFPEEAFRAMVASLTQIHFAPTARAAANLKMARINPDNIIITGNTSIDALKITLRKAPRLSPELKELVPDRRIVLVTMHRRESWDEGLQAVCRGVLRLADMYPDIQIILPVHVNPRVREPIRATLRNKANIRLIEPLPHAQFIALLQRSYLVLTDSGGVQEEAPALGVPALVLRKSTERMEAIDAGVARLVGTDLEAIVAQAAAILSDSGLHRQMARRLDIFGDGHASERIVRAIQNHALGHSPLLDKGEQFSSPVSP